jgi:hypothetical protein
VKIRKSVVSGNSLSRNFVADFPSRRVITFLIDFKIILAGQFYMFTFDEAIKPYAVNIAPFAHWLGVAWFYLYLLLILASRAKYRQAVMPT